MKPIELLRLVWINLSQNKFKVIMTSIGIVVGSATIMLVIAIGTGGKMEVAEQFKNLNAGAIDISYEMQSSGFGGGFGQGMSSGGGMSSGRSSSGLGSSSGSRMPSPGGMPSGGGRSSGGAMPSGGMFPGGAMLDFGSIFGGRGDESDRLNQEKITLSVDEMEELTVFVPGLSDATISYSSNATVEGGELEESTNYTIAGVLHNYMEMSNLSLQIGEFISEDNETGKEKVCVLGYSVAKTVFGSAYDAYDEIVYIDSRPYVVKGVFAEMGTVASGINPDSAIFIPYSTGIKYLVGESVSPTITVIAKDVNHVNGVIADIEAVLGDIYPNAEFTISDAGSKMEAASASNETLTILLVAMAVIVFIVGGIGIMNVLFVSVKERTNEIGVLKALGCSRKDILLEFLMEAACTSLVGAILGVLLALAVTPIVEALAVRVELSILGALLSLIFGVLTGSVFGFYPAYKASRLVPVVALNQE